MIEQWHKICILAERIVNQVILLMSTDRYVSTTGLHNRLADLKLGTCHCFALAQHL